jgi:cell division protease FtsH
MVTQYGFSEKVGTVSYAGGGEVFIGRDMGQVREYSESTAQAIDSEMHAILENAHNEAYKAINLNRKVLDALAKALMENETLNQEEIAAIFKPIKKLPIRAQWLSSKSRPVSKLAPIAIPRKGSSALKQAAIDKAAATSAAKKPVRKPAAKKPVAKVGPKTAATKPAAKKPTK